MSAVVKVCAYVYECVWVPVYIFACTFQVGYPRFGYSNMYIIVTVTVSLKYQKKKKKDFA